MMGNDEFLPAACLRRLVMAEMMTAVLELAVEDLLLFG
jgi:hypothetical protein